MVRPMRVYTLGVLQYQTPGATAPKFAAPPKTKIDR